MKLASRLGVVVVMSLTTFGSGAEPAGVTATLHNLSVSGPGEVRSLKETQICKFCHVPHTAVVNEPLWGHALSNAQYKTPEIRRKSGSTVAPQPDGASRLCLSCHDGTVAIGNVHGSGRSISMSGDARITPGRKGYIGTDLSGSHPVSVVIPETPDPEDAADTSVLPRSIIESKGSVRLDPSGRIQCTTCHDPHSDSYYKQGSTPHFFVKPTVTEVCLACHELR